MRRALLLDRASTAAYIAYQRAHDGNLEADSLSAVMPDFDSISSRASFQVLGGGRTSAKQLTYKGLKREERYSMTLCAGEAALTLAGAWLGDLTATGRCRLEQNAADA